MLVFLNSECPACDCLIDEVKLKKPGIIYCTCLGCNNTYLISLADIQNGYLNEDRIIFIRNNSIAKFIRYLYEH